MSRFKKEKFLYCVANVALRVVMIYVAHLIDTTSTTIKFTDTDYDVFSDAAMHVANGNSPFARKTYRYTPLAAYICLVNPLVHPLACKFIFKKNIPRKRWVFDEDFGEMPLEVKILKNVRFF